MLRHGTLRAVQNHWLEVGRRGPDQPMAPPDRCSCHCDPPIRGPAHADLPTIRSAASDNSIQRSRSGAHGQDLGLDLAPQMRSARRGNTSSGRSHVNSGNAGVRPVSRSAATPHR
jgi:hypothetical protein